MTVKYWHMTGVYVPEHIIPCNSLLRVCIGRHENDQLHP